MHSNSGRFGLCVVLCVALVTTAAPALAGPFKQKAVKQKLAKRKLGKISRKDSEGRFGRKSTQPGSRARLGQKRFRATQQRKALQASRLDAIMSLLPGSSWPARVGKLPAPQPEAKGVVHHFVAIMQLSNPTPGHQYSIVMTHEGPKVLELNGKRPRLLEVKDFDFSTQAATFEANLAKLSAVALNHNDFGFVTVD